MRPYTGYHGFSCRGWRAYVARILVPGWSDMFDRSELGRRRHVGLCQSTWLPVYHPDGGFVLAWPYGFIKRASIQDMFTCKMWSFVVLTHRGRAIFMEMEKPESKAKQIHHAERWPYCKLIGRTAMMHKPRRNVSFG